ncbi:DUF1983 domain-containing protein [Vibrio furnissii]|uniref:TipJ family phage tail tip protein n=1 Tax=Vibrio furnissii TaxID=29494 RepID=UPI00374A05C2
MNRAVISGRKGDDTPSEDPNTLKSIANARMLLALGEGEFEGGIDGKRIYLDGTPLVSESGTLNFSNVVWAFRPGTVDQDYIAGFPAIEAETAVGVELKSDTPWVTTLTNSLLSACILRFRWPALQRQKDNGDLVGYSISYRIDVAVDGGPFEVMSEQNVTGKTTSDYERSVRVDLPAGNFWTVRVVRLTPNQNSSKYADVMYVSAVTEVIDLKLRYPNTALLGISFDATQFSNIPEIAVLAKLRKIRVPDNYDPETRTYTGIWTGGFKLAYSNNPAWVTYDLIIENRFSIGDKVGAEFVNKYELYKIAQYCDQQVPDGKGGTEHRFECNIYIQTAAEAWQVLRDISAIYRGMVYWMQSQMVVRADMPRDPDYIFTNANVVDGTFTYSGSDERTKCTRALVSYDNPDNQYETDVTTAFDDDLQRRYGDNVVELAAYGCTRESEAQRRGKWAIYTNNTDRMVTFKTGMEGEIPLLGDIIAVADQLVAGSAIGGRVSQISADGLQITLDREMDLTAGDGLRLNLPSGKSELRTVTGCNGRVVSISLPYSEAPRTHCQWTIERATITHQLFQVLSVKKADTESIGYEISGIEYDPGKFDYVDTGARLEERPVSNIPVGGQVAPAAVSIAQAVHVEQTIAVTTMTISWSETEGAVGYDVQWQKDAGEWVTVPRTGQLSVDVKGVYSGQYIARVRAVNAAGVYSVARSSTLTDITGKEGQPPALAIFRTTPKPFEILLDWSFPEGAEDTLYTEVQYSQDAQGTVPLLLGQYSYPTTDHSMRGLSAGVEFWFRARIIDRTGNIGPWTAWTYGQSSVNADEILSYLEGQIGTGELAPGLIEQIGEDVAAGIIIDVDNKLAVINQTISDLEADVNQKISAANQTIADLEADVNQKIDTTNQTVADLEADVNQRIDTTNQNVADLEADVNQRIDTTNQTVAALEEDVNQRISATNQTVADLEADVNQKIDSVEVDFDGKIDGINQSLIGHLAGDDEYASEDVLWYAGDDGEQESFVGNVSTTSAYNSEDYARAKQISVLAGRVGDNQAYIAHVELTSVSRDEAIAQTLSELSVSVGENSALIASEQFARATADESLSRSIAALNAEVGDNSAKMLNEQTARVNADGALSQEITALKAEVDDNAAAITSEASARASEDSALSTRIDTLTAEVGDNAAAILAEQTARVNADGALSQEITALTAEVGDNAAAILAEQTARVNADGALSQEITALKAEVDENAAAITSEASARASEDSALSTRIDTLTAEVGDNAAAILAEQTARVNADGALSQEINALTAEVGDNAAAILAEQTSRADGDSALATSINALKAEVDDNSAAIVTESEVRAGAVSELDGKLTDDAIKSFGYLAGDDEQTEDLFQWYAGDDGQQESNVGNVSATSASNERDYTLARQLTVIQVKSEENAAAITSEQLARVSANEALASDINSLSAEVGDNKALILSEQLARSTADESLARTIQALGSKVGDTEAKLTLEQTTRAAEDDALSQQILTLTAEVGDNSAAILAEQTARVNADGALSQEITALTAEVGDNSAAILAEQTARVNADGALSQEITALKAEVDDNAAAITSEASARASEDSALSTRIDSLTAEVGDNSAAILAEQTARVNADGALSQEISALTAEVGDNAAAILAEQTSRADGDSALATSINALKAEVDDNSAAIVTESEVRAGAVSELGGKLTDDAIKSFGYLAGDDEQTEDLFQWYAGDDGQRESNVGNVSATSASNERDYTLARQLTVIQVKSEENAAAITSEQLARVSANEALASDINSLSAEVGDNKALILSEQLARSTADESLARTIQALGSKVSDTEAKLTLEQTTRAAEDDALSQQILTLTAEVGDNSAAILAEQTARVNADGALSQEITALTAEVGDNAAAILAEKTARANEDSALAQDIQTLSAQVGNAEAAIQQASQAVANLDGSLKANWQVKTEVRQDGKVVQAGVGLGASIGEDGTSRSEFLVMADTIGFLNSIDGQIHSPFVFDTVNDTAFLNTVFIGDATIDFAKISDTLESTNFVSGSAGWQIKKDGAVEFNNGVFRGQLYVEDLIGDVVKAYPYQTGYTTGTTIWAYTVLIPPANYGRRVVWGDVLAGTLVYADFILNGSLIATVEFGGVVGFFSSPKWTAYLAPGTTHTVQLRLRNNPSVSSITMTAFAGVVMTYKD